MSKISHHGTTLSVDGTNVGNVFSLTAPGFEKEAVPTYDLSSTSMTFRPSRIADYGELEFTVYLNDTGHATLIGYASGIGTPNWVVGFNDGVVSGVTCSFAGVPTALSFEEADAEDAADLMASLTVKVSGPATWGGLS